VKELIHNLGKCALLLVAAMAFCQADRGTIAGIVKDPVGEIVAGASVQATNVATGAIQKTVSSKQGTYSVTDLPPGTYDVSLTLQGLAPFSRKGVAQRGQLSGLSGLERKLRGLIESL
jgi:hypothetical protein